MEPDKHKPSYKPQDKTPKNWLSYSGMVFEMFGTIGACALIGWFLDKKLHTAPVLVLIFLLIGLASAFYRIFKQLS